MPSAALLAAGGGNTKTGPYLIKTGNDAPSTSYCTANPAIVAALPFDGFSFDPLGATSPPVNQLIHSTTAVTLAQCQTALSGMNTAKASFGQNNRYFPRVIIQNANNVLDWWNDAQWTTCTQNWANFAQAARAEGCHGLLFDPEWYGVGLGQGPWDWGSTGYQTGSVPSAPGAFGDSGNINPASSPTVGADIGHTLSASRVKVQARGKQVMDAILAQWPTCRILMYHGPYMSSSLTAAALGTTTSQTPPAQGNALWNDVAFANELLGSYEAGFVESLNAQGNKGMFIDGGEIYNARTLADFDKINDWRNRGLKASATTVMSAGVKAAWHVTLGVGVFNIDNYQLGTSPIQPALDIQNQITFAMKRNSYIWFYTEQQNWWGTPFPSTPAPQSYKDAVAAGRTAGRL